VVRYRAGGKNVSAQWTRRASEAGKTAAGIDNRSASETSVQEKQVCVKVEKAKSQAGPQRLPDEEWNFTTVADEDLWACLIWEYGRSADWIHGILPQRSHTNDAEVGSQIGRFHYSNPSKTLKILNEMRLWQWMWSQNNGLQQVEFFPAVPWSQLPPIVRANMRRAVDGLEPAADLPLLHKLLSKKKDDDGSGALQAAKIMTQLRIIEPPLDTLEEKTFLGEPQHWLPGGNGFDDVTDGVITGERFLQRLRDGMAQYLTGKITPAEAQNLLQAVVAGEISLWRFREDKQLNDEGYSAVAFRLNWNLKNRELMEKFEQWLRGRRPRRFHDQASGNRTITRGPRGIKLCVRRGKNKSDPIEPWKALKVLGVWRGKQGLEKHGIRDWTSYFETYDPDFHNPDFKIKSAQTEASESRNFTRQIFRQLFPKRGKSRKKF
jgi:hypothetical protein